MRLMRYRAECGNDETSSSLILTRPQFSMNAEVIEWPTADEIERAVRLLIEAMNMAESLLGEAIFDYDSNHSRSGAERLMTILKEADNRKSVDHSG